MACLRSFSAVIRISAALLRSASESMGFLRGIGPALLLHCVAVDNEARPRRDSTARPRLKPVGGGFALMFAISQRRQFSHPLADFLAGEAKFIQRLQVEPELRSGPEPVTQPQGGVGRHTTLSVNDRRNAIHRNVDLSC